MIGIDAYIIYKEQRYDLAYRTSVYWLMDGEGFAHFDHLVKEAHLIDVVMSHFNCTSQENPALHLQLRECLGELDDDSDMMIPEIFLGNFGIYTISGENEEVSMANIVKVDMYYRFDLRYGGQLYIAEEYLDDFGLGELTDDDVDVKVIKYDTSAVDMYMIAEDYKEMIVRLRELVGKMNEVYARNGEEQIVIVD